MATRRTGSSDFVSVACRLPQGLHIKVPNREEVIKLHGSASPYAIAGHGMTQVRAGTWAAIAAAYKDAAWLKNEAVFCATSQQSASSQALERKDVDAGFDPVDPNDPSAGLPASVLIQKEGEPDA